MKLYSIILILNGMCLTHWIDLMIMTQNWPEIWEFVAHSECFHSLQSNCWCSRRHWRPPGGRAGGIWRRQKWPPCPQVPPEIVPKRNGKLHCCEGNQRGDSSRRGESQSLVLNLSNDIDATICVPPVLWFAGCEWSRQNHDVQYGHRWSHSNERQSSLQGKKVMSQHPPYCPPIGPHRMSTCHPGSPPTILTWTKMSVTVPSSKPWIHCAPSAKSSGHLPDSEA